MSKILNPLKWTHRLKARFRLWLDLCPRCNSDAPAIDTCWVCWHGKFVSKRDKNTLKRRWDVYREIKEKEAESRAKNKGVKHYDWPTE